MRTKEKLVTWTIPKMPKKLKDEFLGLAKMSGKDGYRLLQNLIKGFVYDTRKDMRLGDGKN